MSKSKSVIVSQIVFIIELFKTLLTCFDSNSDEYLLIEHLIDLCEKVSKANYKKPIDKETYSHLPYHKQYRYRKEHSDLLPTNLNKKTKTIEPIKTVKKPTKTIEEPIQTVNKEPTRLINLVKNVKKPIKTVNKEPTRLIEISEVIDLNFKYTKPENKLLQNLMFKMKSFPSEPLEVNYEIQKEIELKRLEENQEPVDKINEEELEENHQELVDKVNDEFHLPNNFDFKIPEPMNIKSFLNLIKANKDIKLEE